MRRSDDLHARTTVPAGLYVGLEVEAREVHTRFRNERGSPGYCMKDYSRHPCLAPFGPAYGCSKSLPTILSG